jgi:epoxide hydrolase-like predicted phosphatase
MPIKAVIWDIGGVIARTEDRVPRDELANELGVTREYLNELFFSGTEGTRAQKGEITTGELIVFIRGQLGLAPDEHTDIEERFFAGDQVDYELVDFIRSLKPKYKIGIISNAWPGVENQLEIWGIRDAFDVIIGSGDIGIMKPDSKIYQLALERLGVNPEESVFVDDFIENINGARGFGMNGVYFQNTTQAIGDLKALLDVP